VLNIEKECNDFELSWYTTPSEWYAKRRCVTGVWCMNMKSGASASDANMRHTFNVKSENKNMRFVKKHFSNSTIKGRNFSGSMISNLMKY